MATKKATKKAKWPKLDERDDFMRRSFAAWFRSGGMEQPGDESGVESHGGKLYATLRNAGGLLAVYRIRNDGMLKGMRRWPKSIK